MNSIKNIDVGFSTLDFTEIPSELFLSNRKDLKYVIGKDLIQHIFERLKGEYKIVVKSGKTDSMYTTNYYDTEDFLFYSDHHRGKLNRQKVRTRTYEDGISFLEIKRKDNKGVTHKSRIQIDISTFEIENYNSFIDHLGGFEYPLSKKLMVQYNRVTLYHKSMNEKLTFDFSYCAKCDDRIYELDDIILVESKGLDHKYSFFNRLMREMKIRPVSFSKYCFGLINIEDHLKANEFKPLLRKLEKFKK